LVKKTIITIAVMALADALLLLRGDWLSHG
jgi:hypothetical protein